MDSELYPNSISLVGNDYVTIDGKSCVKIWMMIMMNKNIIKKDIILV